MYVGHVWSPAQSNVPLFLQVMYPERALLGTAHHSADTRSMRTEQIKSVLDIQKNFPEFSSLMETAPLRVEKGLVRGYNQKALNSGTELLVPPQGDLWSTALVHFC